MLNQLTKTTKHKFYNKWLYKVSIRIPGATLLRIHNRQQVDEFCNKALMPPTGTFNNWRQRAWKNRSDIRDLLRLLDDYSDSDWARRIEHDQVDLYTNKKDLYDELSERFEILLVHRFEPDPETIDALENRNGKTMVVKKLPHGRFNYRVYLLPHTIKDTPTKERFLNWLDTLKPRVTCTDSVKGWFLKNKTNWDRRYILVEDEGTLIMLKMRNPDLIGTVYKFEII